MSGGFKQLLETLSRHPRRKAPEGADGRSGWGSLGYKVGNMGRGSRSRLIWEFVWFRLKVCVGFRIRA